MLSVASSRAKSVDVRYCGFIHQGRGSPLMGEWLPPNVTASDDSLPVHSATTAMSEDPSAASPSVRPTLGAVTWANGGTDHATTSGTATVASDYVLPITVAATTTYIGRASTGGVVPIAVSTTSASSSSIRPDVGSGIASLTGCLATSKGVPLAPAPSCPTKGGA